MQRRKCLGLVSMLLSCMLLLWVRTFTDIANGVNSSIFHVLGKTLLTLLGSFVYGGIIYILGREAGFFYRKDLDDEEQGDEKNSGLGRSIIVVLTMAVIFQILCALSELGGIDFFYDGTGINSNWWIMNKKVFFILLTVSLFPAMSTYIVRKISESRCSAGAVVSGTIQILALTVMEFMLYMKKCPNILLIGMSLMNVFSLIAAIKGYLWEKTCRKGNAVALVICYGIFWGMLISMRTYNSETFLEFMEMEAAFDPSLPSSYISNVNKILGNAVLVGQNPILLRDPYILSFMKNRSNSNSVLAALFYGGWSSAFALIVLEIIFVLSSIAVFIHNKREDGWDTTLCIACIFLVVRIVVGVPFSFGILPIPVFPLFATEFGIIADSICMGLILVTIIANKFNEWFEELNEEILWEDGDEDDE